MKSERLLRAGRDLVAVRATAPDFAASRGFPSSRSRMWLDRAGDPQARAAQAQPEHDRLRPGARDRSAPRALAYLAPARPRRALGRCPRAVPALRSDLADFRRRAPGRLPPQPGEGLVGAVLDTRNGARHRHRLVAVSGVLTPRRPRGPLARGPGQPRDDPRLRLPGANRRLSRGPQAVPGLELQTRKPRDLASLRRCGASRATAACADPYAFESWLSAASLPRLITSMTWSRAFR